MNYRFIESKEELQQICDNFLKEEVIGVDLEADSLYCFKEKICLIQIATADEAFLIDPFVLKEISPFLNILENKDIIKIFHGSDFDIRSIDRDYHAKVNNLFDTEIACRFLGLKERGLGSLLKRNFNINSNKKYQKANWSKRPFLQEMIKYSVMDVKYLTKLYNIINKKLTDNGRFTWAKEEFEIQEQVRYENHHSAPLFKKFKGAGKLEKRSLAVLENLLQLRIKIAQKKNQPLFKIISNSSLTTLSVNRPETIAQILEIKALSRKQIDIYGKLCLEEINKAMKIEHDKLPSYPKTRGHRINYNEEKRIKSLKKLREKLSTSMGIEPGFLLNNSLITAIAIQAPQNSEALLEIDNIRRWQVQNIGDDIISAVGYCS